MYKSLFQPYCFDKPLYFFDQFDILFLVKKNEILNKFGFHLIICPFLRKKVKFKAKYLRGHCHSKFVLGGCQ